ncbi:hypothetical protein SOVF_162640, partial [Spinacia oleracea]
MEEDEFFIELISNSKNPKGVLDLARDMKETGNFLFKQGSIEDALEKYGYAGIILGCFQFEENDDRAEFFDLANCILLNSASCFSRKNEFEQVGQICLIILEFSPSNVKAMFRRAMAAIELGRSDLAYWDLIMASHSDPKNPEVLKKLEDVKQSLTKEDAGKSSQDPQQNRVTVVAGKRNRAASNRGLRGRVEHREEEEQLSRLAEHRRPDAARTRGGEEEPPRTRGGEEEPPRTRGGEKPPRTRGGEKPPRTRGGGGATEDSRRKSHRRAAVVTGVRGSKEKGRERLMPRYLIVYNVQGRSFYMRLFAIVSSLVSVVSSLVLAVQSLVI